MATGVEILKKYKNINIRTAIQQTLNETKEAALDLQTEQMFEGKRGSRGNINPQYTHVTVEIKKSKNQVSDRVTLNDTGEFYHSIYFVVKPSGFEFKSNNWKAKDLVLKYGDSIFGLNKDFRARYVSEVLKFHFSNKIKKQIVTG